METLKENIIRETKRIEEDSLYSAKGHFTAAQIWANIHLLLGVPTAILAAIAGFLAFSQLDSSNLYAGFFAIIVTALTAVSTFLNPNEQANCHLNAGNKYNSLRNQARIFYEIECCRESSEVEHIKRLKELGKQRDELNQNGPQIPRWAYKKARKGIEEGEAAYKVDENNTNNEQP